MRLPLGGSRPRPSSTALRLAIIGGACAIGLAASVSVTAESTPGRRAGDPMVEPMTIASADATATRDRVGALARGLGIDGHAAEPQRSFHAADLRIVDETEVLGADGRVRAVVRTDAGSVALRSIVRLDWTPATQLAVVDHGAAEALARGHTRDAGLTPPSATGDVRWDEAMDAWRVHWARRIDGRSAIGDGLTVWVHRGGQLAALRRSETPAAALPLSLVDPSAADAAARSWAARVGLAPEGLGVDTRPELVWVRPNDFVRRGGADDTEVTLRLAYRVDLRRPLPGGGVHHVALFVDAGSGRIIAGIETA